MSLQLLAEMNQRIGPVYGSEDFSMLLYALVKMQRPLTIVELGTGLGVSAFWMAHAARENGAGHVWTIDDGRHWRERGSREARCASMVEHPCFRHAVAEDVAFDVYIDRMSAALGVRDQLTLLQRTIALDDPASFTPANFPCLERPIDLLFADIAHSPAAILAILGIFLPMLAPSASLFIDSASTFVPSYLALEQTIVQLNQGKVPSGLLARRRPEDRAALIELIASRRFTIMHLVETKARAQNGTAWLKVEPVDVVPYPLTAMRF
jgi:hypothetical protein